MFEHFRNGGRWTWRPGLVVSGLHRDGHAILRDREGWFLPTRPLGLWCFRRQLLFHLGHQTETIMGWEAVLGQEHFRRYEHYIQVFRYCKSLFLAFFRPSPICSLRSSLFYSTQLFSDDRQMVSGTRDLLKYTLYFVQNTVYKNISLRIGEKIRTS